MKIKNSISKISIIVSNSIPLFGVLFYQWDLPSIIFLYWMENLTIGIINVLKMRKAQGRVIGSETGGVKITEEKTRVWIRFLSFVGLNPVKDKLNITGFKNSLDINILARNVLIYYFLIHYGIFTLSHHKFVVGIFGSPKMSLLAILLAFVSVFISHFISYKVNYLGKGEYLKALPSRLFLQPYNRIVIMQLTVLVGGILINKYFDTQIFALVIMIVLKITLDLSLHTRERKKFQIFIPDYDIQETKYDKKEVLKSEGTAFPY